MYSLFSNQSNGTDSAFDEEETKGTYEHPLATGDSSGQDGSEVGEDAGTDEGTESESETLLCDPEGETTVLGEVGDDVTEGGSKDEGGGEGTDPTTIDGEDLEPPPADPTGLDDYQLVQLVDDDGNPIPLAPPLLVPQTKFEQYVRGLVQRIIVDLHMKDVEARKQEAIKASEERARKVRKSRARRRTRKHKVRYNAKTE